MDAQEDLAFMKNVDRWPYWPLLPLAQRKWALPEGAEERPFPFNCGTLFDVTGSFDNSVPKQWRFIAGYNIWGGDQRPEEDDNKREGGEELLQELLAEGWRVD